MNCVAMNLEVFRREFLATGDYIIAHTSGSTGAPKAIQLAKSDMRRSARASNAFFGITGESVLACPLSADYIAGKMMVVRALEAGCRLVELPVANAISLPDFPVDFMPVVPSQLPGLIALDNLGQRVRTILIGGGAPSAKLCAELVAKGVKAFISYGMTETCSHVAIADAADSERVFHAMPGITFDADADGRLIINAPDFSFGSFKVNDLVSLRSHDSFCYLGRVDNVINSGGLKLYPEQLDEMYRQAIGDSVIYYTIGAAHPELGMAVQLVVEGNEADASAIMERLQSSGIPHRFLPKTIVMREYLVRTSSGKLIRQSFQK